MVTLWSYTLSSVEKKFPQEEKELAVLARYWGTMKDLAQGQGIKVITQSQVTANRKAQKPQETEEKSYEWILYTDGSRKGQDDTAYWGYILKQDGKEQFRQKGRVPGSAQAGEVTAILEGLLELEKRKVKTARIITDSYYCAQALKEDLTIWEENGYEGAKGKMVAHQDLWKKIAELRLKMCLDVVHQKAHGKEGAHWKGNDEVDRYVQQRRIVFVGREKWEQTPKGRVVPESSVVEVVQAVHEALGHVGTMPTRKELEKQQLWIPVGRVRQVLKDCDVCGRYNAGRRGRRVDGLTIKSTVPWGSVCMDAAGPLGITGKKVDQWCQQNGVMRIYSPPYTPQANGVVERTIGLVKNWIGKNANTKEWSTKALELGKALNDRHRSDRPSPSEELNGRPFVSEKVGRGEEEKKAAPGLRIPFEVGQRVWIKARDHPMNTAVKAKYEVSDIVEKILDSNTVLLKKKGIQGVEQLKPVPS
ncbi:hypothetical protein D5F01_LYC24832 [Larimichthys crocea]|uniref:Uncharacterized protein n=1 Tax=Larimichthys crocea TaxID=215358 RepID=A0A6G0HE15_LARCR|nr:hypothetical protein D5F01_LYC24832 [Larimichthys crocea]